MFLKQGDKPRALLFLKKKKYVIPRVWVWVWPRACVQWLLGDGIVARWFPPPFTVRLSFSAATLCGRAQATMLEQTEGMMMNIEQLLSYVLSARGPVPSDFGPECGCDFGPFRLRCPPAQWRPLKCVCWRRHFYSALTRAISSLPLCTHPPVRSSLRRWKRKCW